MLLTTEARVQYNISIIHTHYIYIYMQYIRPHIYYTCNMRVYVGTYLSEQSALLSGHRSNTEHINAGLRAPL